MGGYGPLVSLEDPQNPPPVPGPPQGGDLLPPPPPVPEPLIDDEGYDTDVSDIWQGTTDTKSGDRRMRMVLVTWTVP